MFNGRINISSELFAPDQYVNIFNTTTVVKVRTYTSNFNQARNGLLPGLVFPYGSVLVNNQTALVRTGLWTTTLINVSGVSGRVRITPTEITPRNTTVEIYSK
jgi:hypothetical protein